MSKKKKPEASEKKPEVSAKSETEKKVAKSAQAQALEQAQAEIGELRDKLLRTHAEMDNMRKRAQRQIEDASKFAVEKFASALLDVTDNLERALGAEIADAGALREGVQLTLNSLHEVKRKFGIERVDAVGKAFDPNLHEAMAQIPSAEASGTVIDQHMAGYTLHGRLLRPARVIISSGPDDKED